MRIVHPVVADLVNLIPPFVGVILMCLSLIHIFKILQPLGKALCARGGVGVVFTAFYACLLYTSVLLDELPQDTGWQDEGLQVSYTLCSTQSTRPLRSS